MDLQKQEIWKLEEYSVYLLGGQQREKAHKRYEAFVSY